MSSTAYQVHADWDPEAEVWVATSEDVPGLATEAPTIEILTGKLRTMIPELLQANQLISGDQPEAISFELTSHRHEKVRLAHRRACQLAERRLPRDPLAEEGDGTAQ